MYPADANLIVSLLDIHPRADNDGQERFEILEAGTGHGALTLHLSRAIHGFNAHLAPLNPSFDLTPAIISESADDGEVADPNDKVDLEAESESTSQVQNRNVAASVIGKTWMDQRKAVIHTLDISVRHSLHAQATIQNFRQGIYTPNIDYHVGTISAYLSSRLSQSPDSFLDHTILDLPSPHEHLEIVGQALKPNGFLIVFCPSITQINICVQKIKNQKLPFLLETVLELGAGIGVGGREWDVRPVKPRALIEAQAQARKASRGVAELIEGSVAESTEVGSSEADSVYGAVSPLKISESPEIDSGWEMVCRPKVGGRVSGGGFVGLFRRMEQY